MNKLLINEKSKDTSVIGVFCDSLMIKYTNTGEIVAFRAPKAVNCGSVCVGDIDFISETEHFAVYQSGELVGCRLLTPPFLESVISPVSEDYSQDIGARMINEYIRKVYSVKPYSMPRLKTYEIIEETVNMVAAYCGCLTDISRSENDAVRILDTVENAYDPDSALIGASLPIISLMFRRISALRGFNFRLTFADGIPCLCFSAKILLDSNKKQLCDLPEYKALKDLIKSCEAVLSSKLTDLNDELNDGRCERICRFSIAVCPQNCDPRGILRAEEWKKQVKPLLEKIELDIPGRF